MKTNIILHTTTSCNYNCSYCDVIKDNKYISKQNLENILIFIKINKNFINNFKFFWWEPLLNFKHIKFIIDNSKKYIWNNFEIVTNASLLSDEVWEYFNKYFRIIFFSIDTENYFDFEKIWNFINKYNLKEKSYFNLTINPWDEEKSLDQFKKLYNMWFRLFNILPVYYTKTWTKENLWKLSKIMKFILDLYLKDNTIKLYWFQKNTWKETKLINDLLFIDVDAKIYYSDIISTYFWKKIKKNLYIWDTKKINIEKIEKNDFEKYLNRIKSFEEKINIEIKWQKELSKIMDYFSEYLNKSNEKQKKLIIKRENSYSK